MIFFQKTIDDIRSDMILKITAVQEKGYLPSIMNFYRGPFRGLIELWSWGLYQLYVVMDNAISQAIPDQATEDFWVDMHCKQIGITRIEAQRTIGKVVFIRDDAESNIVVPKERIIATEADGNGKIYRFITSKQTIIPQGSLEYEIPVYAEFEGASYNVSPYAISVIKTHIPGIISVENRQGWIENEGVDPESKASLKERYKLAWMGFGGCNKAAYESWTRAIPGVYDVKILDNHPRGQGTIDLIILGTGGLPSNLLISSVQEKIEKLRPINDDVLVKAPETIGITVNALVVITDATQADSIIDSVRLKLIELFDPLMGFSIGQDVTRDRLVSEIFSVSSVIKRIDWSLPANEVVYIGDGQLAILDGLPQLSTIEETE